MLAIVPPGPALLSLLPGKRTGGLLSLPEIAVLVWIFGWTTGNRRYFSDIFCEQLKNTGVGKWLNG